MKKLLITVSLLVVTHYTFASGIFEMDSVGLEREAGKTYILHQVDEKETLFAISRRYKTPVNDIVQNNEVLKEGLKIGQKIRIPYIEKSEIPADAKLHHVGPGETLFSIARSNQVSLQDLMDWNELKGNDLSVGQPLIIKGVVEAKETDTQTDPDNKTEELAQVAGTPAPKPEASKEAPKKDPTSKAETPKSTTPASTGAVSTTGGWITHTVGQGQTLFSIAKQYDAKVEDLISWNGLSSNNLSMGQKLKVGRETNVTVAVSNPNPAPANAEERASTPPPVNNENRNPAITTNTSASTEFKNIKETGQAEVIEGTGNHKKYLVLHRNAPVGTIMRIRNEENDVTVFARVVGVLPDTGNNNKLIVKVSKAAFDQLRAVNSRFPVEISY